jgi:hypothetical protein
MVDKVIILRKWKEPHITAFMNQDEIGAKMDIDEYLESLVSQITNIPLVFTKASLLEKLKQSHVSVATEMRQMTKHIV